MNTVVILRPVPDLVEPLVLAEGDKSLAWAETIFAINETDDHALEEAILLKERFGGTVTVFTFGMGDIDQSLYAAVAKGTDRVVKIAWEEERLPETWEAMSMLKGPIESLAPDLVLLGCQAHPEVLGMLAPELAVALNWPYVGVLRGVKMDSPTAEVSVFKEYPGAVLAEIGVTLPAVLGILAASSPPRYVPVGRIRAIAQQTRFEELTPNVVTQERGVTIERLWPPPVSGRAQILEGTEEKIADEVLKLLGEKGLLP